MPRPSRVTTALGAVMQEFRLRYGFSHQDLVRHGWITRSQIEQLSRMATNVREVHQMTTDRRMQILTDLATATARWIQERNPADLSDARGLAELVKHRLAQAAEEDIAEALREPLAISIALRLQEITGRPLLQMAVDVEDPNATLESLWEKWAAAQKSRGCKASEDVGSAEAE